MTTATDKRVSELEQRLERLRARAGAGSAETRARMQHQFETVRMELAALGASLGEKAEAVDAKFAELDWKIAMMELGLEAELADDQVAFADAVEAELVEWDEYINRKQAKTTDKTAAASERAEQVVADLKRRRAAVAESLRDARTSSGDAWRKTKERILTSLAEMRRKADDLRH
jgi:hypothetical protein